MNIPSSAQHQVRGSFVYSDSLYLISFVGLIGLVCASAKLIAGIFRHIKTAK